jgi:ATP-dependent RNA helicase SUPV3L1/SUV3
MALHERGRVTAVLGPTNTGKTHHAIERMLGHRTGVIGLPLRLLAREVYERCVAARGPSVVALVTGEERIVPPRAAYWVCTVEAMPVGMGADFLAVDEIQLCADPERGHVFTDRLLNARGLHETLFLGADTMRGAIAALVPGVRFVRRERFSTLSYTGEKKVSRMQPRSAVVGFSVESVYAIAELIRRQKGGAAVVMGALSPRTRNAQVAMYQEGDVDFLVATDAIGMGLNLDVKHVAFSSTSKFDGRRMRPLQPNELAQIAGRAGRHMTPGTFGVTGEAPPIHPEVVEAITESRFLPVRRLMWRNSDLRFGSVDALIGSLEARTDNDWLSRARDADDVVALKALAEDRDVRRRAMTPAGVKLLWEVCRIPDFRGISAGEHANMLGAIHGFLFEHGRVPDDWLGRQIQRIDRTDGDIDTLSKRLAYIRTWTYVAQRKGWVDDEDGWREATRAVEDRLSDALHGALTQRFVDRRTSVLLRKLKQKETLVAELSDTGDVTVEGQALGRLEGFRFRQGASGGAEEARAMRQAAQAALIPEFNLRADRFYNAPDTEIDFTEQGGLMWGEHAVGKLVAGDEPLKPRIQGFVDDEAGPEVRAKVERRLGHFMDRRIQAQMEPLVALQRDEGLSGVARGFAFRMVEGFGIIPRGEVAQEVRDLDQEARGLLRKHGVRFGQFTVFLPALLKPAPTRLRLVLWGLSKGLVEFPEAPPPGLVTIPAGEAPEGYFAMSGYRAAGDRAIRIDMLERLADMLRAEDSKGGFEAKPGMLSITGTTLEQFAALMEGLGYRAARGERPKRAAEPPPASEPDTTPIAEAAPAVAGMGQDAGAASGTDAAAASAEPAEAAVAMAEPADAPVAARGESQAAETRTAARELRPATAQEVPPGPSEVPGDVPGEVPPPPSEPDISPDPAPPVPDPAPEVPQPDPAPGGDPELPDPSAPQPGPTEIPTEVPDAPGEAPGEIPLPDGAPELPTDPPPGIPVEVPPATPGMASSGAAPQPDAQGDATQPPGSEAAEPAETEVFFTFIWGGLARNRSRARRDGTRDGEEAREGGPRRRGRRNRQDQSQGQGQSQDQGEPGARQDRARGERPAGRAEGAPRRERGAGPKGDGAKGDKRTGKPPKRDDQPRRYSAGPERRDRIDPDNPFAAALMGLKDKD